MQPSTRRVLSVLSLLTSFTLFVFAIACTSEASPSEPTPEVTPATPTSTAPIATPTRAVSTPTTVAPTATPPAAGAQTGIKAVDRVIAAVAARDGFQLASLAYLEAKACTITVGLGGPPECRPGEAPGTIVHVFYTSSCDGHYLRQAEVGPLMTRFVEDRGRLVGVYRHNGLLFPSSQYVLVYNFETAYGTLARALFVSDPGIVGVTFACGSDAKEFIEATGLRDAVLLP